MCTENISTGKENKMLKAFFVFKIEIKLIFEVESLVVLMLFLDFVFDEKKSFQRANNTTN